MKLAADLYVDRVGRTRVSLAGYNSIGFQNGADAAAVHRRILKHSPTTVAQLQAVTGLNRASLAKLLREPEK